MHRFINKCNSQGFQEINRATLIRSEHKKKNPSGPPGQVIFRHGRATLADHLHNGKATTQSIKGLKRRLETKKIKLQPFFNPSK